MLKNSVRVTEVFYSLQGETRTVGLPTVFVRLTGCPLRCQYCDSAYAFYGGKRVEFADILADIGQYQAKYVTVTGGEPLAQQECHALLTLLCDNNYDVSLETSGALAINNVDQRVTKVVDLKTPGSGECERNLYENIDYLNPGDQVKFVCCSRDDYDWSKQVINEYSLLDKCEVLFSSSHHQLQPQQLADWILTDRLPVRFQVQLHKYLWGDVPGK